MKYNVFIDTCNTHARTYTRTHAYPDTRNAARTHMHTRRNTHTHIPPPPPTHTHTHIHTHIHTATHPHTHAHTDTHTHTHTHTHKTHTRRRPLIMFVRIKSTHHFQFISTTFYEKNKVIRSSSTCFSEIPPLPRKKKKKKITHFYRYINRYFSAKLEKISFRYR